jgi:hypothetical protein
MVAGPRIELRLLTYMHEVGDCDVGRIGLLFADNAL